MDLLIYPNRGLTARFVGPGRIWDLTTGTSQVLEGHADPVTDLVVLPEPHGVDFIRGSVAIAPPVFEPVETYWIWDLTTGFRQKLGDDIGPITSLPIFPEPDGMNPANFNAAGRFASGS